MHACADSRTLDQIIYQGKAEYPAQVDIRVIQNVS